MSIWDSLRKLKFDLIWLRWQLRDKNLLASTGVTGLIPGPGRSHVPRSNKVHAPQQLSFCPGAQELQPLSPRATATDPNALEPVLHDERPPQWEAHTPRLQSRPHSPQLEKSLHGNRDPAQFSSVQSLSRVRLFATPWTAARQASLSLTNAWTSCEEQTIAGQELTQNPVRKL